MGQPQKRISGILHTFVPGGAPRYVSPREVLRRGGGGFALATSPATDQGGIRIGEPLPEQKWRIPEMRVWECPMDEPSYRQTHSLTRNHGHAHGHGQVGTHRPF